MEQQMLMTIPEAARRLALSRSTLYRLIRQGQLRTIRVGRARRVPVTELARFTEQLVAEAGSASDNGQPHGS